MKNREGPALGWHWIILTGEDEWEPAFFDGECFLVNGLASELWPVRISGKITPPKKTRRHAVTAGA